MPSEEQVQQVADAISEASFDLYSGVDDRILRGVDFNLAIDPSTIPDAEAAGVESIDASFPLRLAGVNEEQGIAAPTAAQPLEEARGQGRGAPRRQGRGFGRPEQRIEPEPALRPSLERRDLTGQLRRLATVPAVREHDHDGAAMHPLGRVAAVELGERGADLRAAAPPVDALCNQLQRRLDGPRPQHRRRRAL